jgi:hypothetical protein
MRTSLNIDQLEKRAQVAYEAGNDSLHDQLWQQAQSLRAGNPWIMDKDRDPMRKTNAELKVVNMQLKSVATMANTVNAQHSENEKPSPLSDIKSGETSY